MLTIVQVSSVYLVYLEDLVCAANKELLVLPVLTEQLESQAELAGLASQELLEPLDLAAHVDFKAGRVRRVHAQYTWNL